MSNNHNQTANLICAKAIQLIKNYYEHLDKPDKRKQWTDFFMPIQTDHPLMIWNGHILPNADRISANEAAKCASASQESSMIAREKHVLGIKIERERMYFTGRREGRAQ